jgi:hypothetical protein
VLNSRPLHRSDAVLVKPTLVTYFRLPRCWAAETVQHDTVSMFSMFSMFSRFSGK